MCMYVVCDGFTMGQITLVPNSSFELRERNACRCGDGGLYHTTYSLCRSQTFDMVYSNHHLLMMNTLVWTDRRCLFSSLFKAHSTYVSRVLHHSRLLTFPNRTTTVHSLIIPCTVGYYASFFLARFVSEWEPSMEMPPVLMWIKHVIEPQQTETILNFLEAMLIFQSET